MSTALPSSQSALESSAVIPIAAMNAEEFDRFAKQKNFELVNGRLVERAMGVESDRIGSRLLTMLTVFVEAHALGFVLGPQSGFKLRSASGGESVRKPDISFVRFGRFPNDETPDGWAELAPDLAVEVISPGDLAEELRTKLLQYKENGIRLVWVLWPELRTIDVHRADGSMMTLAAAEVLDGEDVVPGFRQSVVEIFHRPRPAGEK